jgi:Flp pilus assembly protein TadG
MMHRFIYSARRRSERIARGETCSGDKGVILIETAMCVTFLMGLLVATFELGMGWRTSITNSNAARAGARVAASQGQGYQADYSALLSISAGLNSVSRATINRVVIFKATAGSTTVPAACLAANAMPTSTGSPGGVSGVCNVYSAAQVTGIANNSITAASFGSGVSPYTASAACRSTALDKNWCPFVRANVQSAGLDNVGVYVQVSTLTYTKMFGTSFTITDSEIMQVEPSAIGS